MINKVRITNPQSESIEFVLRSPEPSGFFIRGIDGLGPPKAVINTTDALSLDGSLFNSARLTSRNIVFKLGFLESPTIEHTRRESYRFFPLKKSIDIEIETDIRTYKTSGYVESNEPDIFSSDEGSIISVICPNPYFYDPATTVIFFSHTDSGFEFPWANNSLTEKLLVFGNITSDLETTVFYSGDSEIGIILNIHAAGSVVNLKIFNLTTRQTMEIDHDILVALTGFGIINGDDIKITTIRGQKSVILTRGGIDINILNALTPESEWFTIEKGDNIFFYEADSGANNISVTLEYQVVFEGI